MREELKLANGWVLKWDSNHPNIMYVDDEADGTWSDSAIRINGSKILYGFPERIPQATKDAVVKFFRKVRRKA